MYVMTEYARILTIVANGIVVFHILTFIVWGIIFAKDLMMPVHPPVGDRKKEQ